MFNLVIKMCNVLILEGEGEGEVVALFTYVSFWVLLISKFRVVFAPIESARALQSKKREKQVKIVQSMGETFECPIPTAWYLKLFFPSEIDVF